MGLPEGPTIPETDPSCRGAVGNLQKIYAKIYAASLRVGFNMWEIFRRLDEHGTNYISEPTFLRVFLGPMKSVIGLQRADIDCLLQQFKVEDGRIAYARILQEVYNRLSPPEQTDEKRELEMQRPNTLTPDNEARVKELLVTFTITITSSDLSAKLNDMRRMFKSVEEIKKDSGLVRRDDFVDVLNKFCAPYTSGDIALVIQRYRQDLYLVKYGAFLKELEQVTKYLIDKNIINDDGTLHAGSCRIPMISDPNITQQDDFVGIDKVLSKDWENSQAISMETFVAFNKLKEQVYREQLRVRYFFIHYDLNETGLVDLQTMHKCVCWICISETSFNDVYLTGRELGLLLKVYQDPLNGSSYFWKVFQADLERDIDPSELESWPQKSLNRKSADPFEVLYRPPACTPPPEEKELTLQDVLQHIYESVKTLENPDILLCEMGKKDRVKAHYLTTLEFDSALKNCFINLSFPELEILRKKYGDNNGIYWKRFADDLQTFRENQTAGHEKQKSQEEKTALAEANEQMLALREGNIIEILGKIKNVLVCKRVWIKDYLKTFDTSQKNVITKAEFEEGLGMCGITLSRKEIDIVFDVFGNPSNQDEVEYTRFCRLVDEDSLPPCPIKPTLEEVIARDMMPEKVYLEQPTHQWANFKQRKALETTMDRLSKYIGASNAEYYKGLDENNTGTISRAVFQRSLITMKCLEVVSNPEIDNVIHCFGIKKGSFLELDYVSFLKALDNIIKTKARANAHR